MTFAQPTNVFNLNFYRMFYDIMKFKKDVMIFLSENEEGLSKEFTLGEFLKEHGYSISFLNNYFKPVCAAVWSVPTEEVNNFPAFATLNFLRNHHLLQISGRPQWITVAGRSREYVKRITEPMKDRIHTSCEVVKVTATEDNRVLLTFSNGDERMFDKVVIASHAPDALKMLEESATNAQREFLSAFPYKRNDVWLHQDASFMPKSKPVWSSWNFMGDNFSSLGNRVYVTYWLNRLQGLEENEKGPICVTLNPPREPDPTLVVSKWTTDHPIPTVASANAAKSLAAVQGTNNVWFCGAYLGHGFHEDGFKSGFAAAHHLINTPCFILPNYPQFSMTTMEKGFKSLVLSYLREFIAIGRLEICEDGGSVMVFGDEREPSVCILVHSANFYTKVALRADLGFADAFIDKDISCSSLSDFFNLCIINRDKMRLSNQGQTKVIATSVLGSTIAYFKHTILRNNGNAQKSQTNIHAHYDLGNAMFSQFLDETMTYSCGIFKTPSDTLFHAQMNKLDALATKAELRPGDHVLEIGFGWGSMALRVRCLVPIAV